MKKLYLTFLWHQHQPYYKDDCDGRYHMPWVYLHALKDYYEMAAHVEKAYNVKCVFNYVPSLLIQLKDYTDFNVADNFLILLRKDTVRLSADERLRIANQCFMANTQNMIRPLKRFSELYDKLVLMEGDTSIFDGAELLDLEVMYLLSWCGEYLRIEDDHIAYLIKKGRNFTEEDKLELLRRGALWVSKIVDIHKRLVNDGKAEISCTPFFHPILPLLTDINSAQEACPDMPMPQVTADMNADADFHIQAGLKEFENNFGYIPTGMWPAEGSISQKTIEKYAKNGIKWIAGDEEVLGNSLRLSLKDPANRKLLYNRHYSVVDGQKIYVFFRDKALSDLIGFSYSSWKEEDAVNDFMSHLWNIYESCNFSPHVSIILDGENAWEYYKNNANNFFTKLYAVLGSADWVETQTFSEVTSNLDIPEEILPPIVAGSWIMGNFRIWIGHPEKNKAWELIAKTKKTLEKYYDGADEDTKTQIDKELHIAQGSDWFWWYGDDHFSIQSDVFDKLFRTHLVNIYKLLKLNIPQELFQPIKSTSKTGLVRKPSYFITPNIDGKFTHFYEWLGSGVFDLQSDAGSMHAGGGDLKRLLYGFDRMNLYLALTTDFANVNADVFEIEVAIGSDRKFFNINLGGGLSENKGFRCAEGNIFEVGIPLKDLAVKNDEKIYLSFKLKRGGIIVEKAPLYNAVEINIYEDFSKDWIV